MVEIRDGSAGYRMMTGSWAYSKVTVFTSLDYFVVEDNIV
jgi:hypothetical protein